MDTRIKKIIKEAVAYVATELAKEVVKHVITPVEVKKSATE